MSFSDLIRFLFWPDHHSASCSADVPEKARALESSVEELDRNRRETMGEILAMAQMDKDFNRVFEPMRVERPGITR